MDAPSDDPVSLLLNIAHSHDLPPQPPQPPVEHVPPQDAPHESVQDVIHGEQGHEGGDATLDDPSPPKKQKRKRSSLPAPPPPPAPSDQPLHYLGLDNTIIRCICGFAEDDGFTIQCDLCGAWEHGFCVGFAHPSDAPESYLCEICDPRQVDRGKAREGQLRMIEQARLGRLAEPGTGMGQDKPRSRGKGRKRTEEDGEMLPPAKPKRGRQQSGRRKTQTAESTPAPSSFPVARPPSRPRDDPEEDEYFKLAPWSMEFIPIHENLLRGLPVRRALRQVYEEWNMDDDTPAVSRTRKDQSHLPSPTEPPQPLSPSPSLYPTPSFAPLAPPLPPVYLSSLDPPTSVKTRVGAVPNVPKKSFLPPSYADHLTMPSLYTRPTIFGLFAASAIPTGSFIGEYLAEIQDPAKYRRDPVNQYALLGTCKPGVRTVGPPVDLILDARSYGSEMRFVRSSCRPNAVIRVIIHRPSSGDKGKREQGGGRVTFGIFASENISKKQEILLGWEWDDAHLVHSVPALGPTVLDGKPGYPLSLYTSSYPDAPFLNGIHRLTKVEREEVARRYEILLAGLGGVFAGCGCMGGGNCVVEQMMEVWKIVRGKSDLPLPEPLVLKEKEKGEKEKGEKEKEMGEEREREGTMDATMAEPDPLSIPHSDSPAQVGESTPAEHPESEREPLEPEKADLGPLIGTVRGWRRKELEVESVRRWRGVVKGLGLGVEAGLLEERKVSGRVDVDVEMETEEVKEKHEEKDIVYDKERDKEGAKGQLGFRSPSSQPSSHHSPSPSPAPESLPQPRRASVSPKKNTTLPLPLPSSSLSPASSRRSLSPHPVQLAGVEEGGEDGESELSNPTDLESDDQDEDDGDLSDATTITLPRSVLSSDGEEEDEDGDAVMATSDAEPDAASKARPDKSKVKRRIDSSPAPEPRPKVVSKKYTKEKREQTKPKAKKKSNPFPFDPTPASLAKPKSRLASVASTSTSASTSKPASSTGIGKKLGKKRQKRIVSSDDGSEEDEERSNVGKKSRKSIGEIVREREGGVTPPLPGATPAPKTLGSLFRDDTPPPPSIPEQYSAARSEPEKKPEQEPVKEKTPPPPAPVEPPKKVSLSEYLKTHKFRKESQPASTPSLAPALDAVAPVSVPTAPAVDAVPTEEMGRERGSAVGEKKEEVGAPLPPPVAVQQPMASLPASTLNLLEHLPSFRNLPAMPAPISPSVPAAVAPAQTPATTVPSAPAEGRPGLPTGASTSYVPRAQAAHTPLQPTAPLQDFASVTHSTASTPAQPARASNSYTPRQVSGEREKSPPLPGLGNYSRSFESTPSYVPRREREDWGSRDRERERESERTRSPVRERESWHFRDPLPHQTPSSSIPAAPLSNDRLPPPLTTRDLPPHASANTPSRVPPMGPKVPPTGPRSVSGGSSGGGPGAGAGPGMDSGRGGFGGRGGYRGFAPRGWRGRGAFRGRGRGG
ncbi:hypothetical protein IAR50_004917 [Cryptococcus sp. DSM 104548]